MSETPAADSKAAELPEIGTDEYNQMMIDKGRQGFNPEVSKPETVETPAAEKPEGVPDKFWDAEKGVVDYEALTKSYTELEKLVGEKETKQGSEDGQETPNQEGDEGDKSAEQKVAEAAGLAWDELQTQVTQNGDLTDDQIAAIEKVGIPREIIDSHIEALKMSQEYLQFQTAEYAGGRDKLDYILKQASQKMDETEIDKMNSMLSGADWKMAIDALKHRFLPGDNTSFGDGGDLFSGLQGQNGSSDVAFQSRDELARAISKRDDKGNRLYDIDPEYRASVQRRLQASKADKRF